MMRAMVLEFPGDPACTSLERQYMLGDDLLVAPVFGADGDVSFYVPEGTWTHFLTGVTVTGPRWHRESHGFMSIPLLVRPGSVIPVGPVEDRPDYDYTDGVTLHVYELADGDRVTTAIPVPDGRDAAVFRTSRAGDVITVESQHAPPGWRVLLTGAAMPAAVTGGTAERQEHRTLVTAELQTVTITFGNR